MTYLYKTRRTRQIRRTGAKSRFSRIVYPTHFGILGWDAPHPIGPYGTWDPWFCDTAGPADSTLPVGISYPYLTGDHYSFDVVTGFGYTIDEDGVHTTSDDGFIIVLATRALTLYASFDPVYGPDPPFPPFYDAGNWATVDVTVTGEERVTGDLEEYQQDTGYWEEQSRVGGEFRRAYYVMGRKFAETARTITDEGDYECREARSVDHNLAAASSQKFGGLTFNATVSPENDALWEANGPRLAGGATGGCAWTWTGPGTSQPEPCAYTNTDTGLSGSFDSITVAASETAGGVNAGNLNARGSAPFTLTATGRLLTVNSAPNPDTCNVVVNVCGTAVALTGVTDSFTVSGTGGGWEVFYAFDSEFGYDHHETAPTGAVIGGGYGADVRYAGETSAVASAHWAMRSRFAEAVIGITQAAQTVVEGAPFSVVGAGLTGGWSVQDNGALTATSSSAPLRFTASAANWRFRRIYADSTSAGAARTLGYRYYRVKIRSVGSANAAFRLTIDSTGENHNWNLATGGDGEWVEREADLFQSDDGDTGQGLLSAEWKLFILGIEGAASGVVLEIESITGFRKHDAFAALLSPGSLIAHRSAQGIGGLHAVTDGHLSLSVPLRTFEGQTRKISDIADEVNAQTAWSGWSAALIKPRRTGKPTFGLTLLSDITDADGFAEWLEAGGPKLGRDARAPLVALFASNPFSPAIGMYPGAGAAHRGGAYGNATTVRFDAITRGQVAGAIVGGGGDVTLVAENAATGADYGNGVARPSDYAITDAPNTPGTFPGGALSPLVRISTDPEAVRAVPLFANVAPPSPKFIDTRVPLRTRLWVRFYRPGGLYRPLTVDGARGWLHLGQGKRIATYHLGATELAFTSGAHPVDGWLRLSHDARLGGRLIALGRIGTAAALFVSGDGGRHIQEVLRVTTDAAAIERDSERGWMVFLYTDTGGVVRRRMSRDGGANWEAAAGVTYAGGGLSATVIDLAQDGRNAGVLLLTCRTGGSTVLLKSQDFGKTWALLLS